MIKFRLVSGKDYKSIAQWSRDVKCIQTRLSLQLVGRFQQSASYFHCLARVGGVLQEYGHGVAGGICRRYSQEPGVRRLFFTGDGDSPVRGDVAPKSVSRLLPGCK